MIYKLKYSTRDAGIADLASKGVINDDGYGEGIESVVEIGQIVSKPATVNSDLTIKTPATFIDGYHFDVMSDRVIDFGTAEITVNHPTHQFWI